MRARSGCVPARVAITSVAARRATMVVVGLTAGTMALAVAAWRSDVAMFGYPSATVAGDVAAGLAFAVAAAAARGPRGQRALVALVGLAWLAGSVWGWAVTLHQGALLLMLAAHPSGRLRSGLALVGLTTGVAVTVATPGPVVTAVMFAVEAAVIAWVDVRALLWRRVFAVCAALLLAGTLIHAHWLAMTARPGEPGVYQTAVATVAIGFVVATWLAGAAPASISQQLIGRGGASGMEGLAGVLRVLLRDPRLELRTDVGEPGLRVRVTADLVVTVRSASPMLADPVVVAAVERSVRLVVEHQRLRSIDELRLADLAAARLRLLGAVDRERAVVAAELSDRVGAPVAAAAARLAQVRRDAADGTAAAFETVARSLAAVQAELAGIVQGVPAAALGQGRLAEALRTLAGGSPVPIAVVAQRAPSLSASAETALFYICREAVANAVKHAAAERITVRLTGDGGGTTLEIGDDGRGGADASGTGLCGLADRASAIGASFAVVSPSGMGTRVVVRLPITGAS
jgi:signal transduction histidine kinase